MFAILGCSHRCNVGKIQRVAWGVQDYTTSPTLMRANEKPKIIVQCPTVKGSQARLHDPQPKLGRVGGTIWSQPVTRTAMMVTQMHPVTPLKAQDHTQQTANQQASPATPESQPHRPPLSYARPHNCDLTSNQQIYCKKSGMSLFVNGGGHHE